MEEKKHCSSCNEVKLRTEFHNNRSRKDGLQSKCKICEKAYQRAYHRKINPNMKKGRKTTIKTWERTNKNWYPDPEWVWTQLENHNSGTSLYNKIDVKYELSDHGNLGKKQTRKNGKVK